MEIKNLRPKRRYHPPKKYTSGYDGGGCGIKMSKMLFFGECFLTGIVPAWLVPVGLRPSGQVGKLIGTVFATTTALGIL